MVRVCEYIEPKNIRSYLRDFMPVYRELSKRCRDPEQFRLNLKKLARQLRKKYHLSLDTYGAELGNPQSGIVHIDLIARCRECASQVIDLAQYHRQIHAEKTLK